MREPTEKPGISKSETRDLNLTIDEQGRSAARRWLIERGFDLDEAGSMLLHQDDTLSRRLRMAAGLALGVGTSLGVGALVGVLHAEVFFLIIVFPLFMGIAVGSAYTLPLRGGVGEGFWFLSMAALLGAGSYIFARWVSYMIIVNDLPPDVSIGFWAYLKDLASTGTEFGIRRPSGFNLSGGWVWLLWSAELSLAGLSSLGGAMTPLGELFSEEASDNRDENQVGQAIEETLQHEPPKTRDILASNAVAVAKALDVGWSKEDMQKRGEGNGLPSHVAWWIVQRAERIMSTCPRCSVLGLVATNGASSGERLTYTCRSCGWNGHRFAS